MASKLKGPRIGAALVCGVLMSMSSATVSAMTLEEAVRHAVETNPQIGEAIANRAATQYELRQARGLYLPSVDAEGSAGIRFLDNPTRRFTGKDGDALYPREIGVTITQRLFNGFASRGEVERQAARVDGASLRVMERSEFIALAVAREYLDVMLKERVIGISRSNVGFHAKVASNLRAGASSGKYSVADRTQAEERYNAATARMTEAEEEMIAARIRFNRVVGLPAGSTSQPPSVAGAVPADLPSALNIAMQNNPSVRLGKADIDAAKAQIRIARADYYPKLFLEGKARTGYDIDGDDGQTDDLGARVYMRWNLYNGGIKDNNVREQKERMNEERMQLQQVYREVEEHVRRAWDRRTRQRDLIQILTAQVSASQKTVDAYMGQFKVGRRSLLDVLSAQNTTFNTSILLETAEASTAFADYQLVAAMGMLLKTLGMAAPESADDYARDKVHMRRAEPEEPASLDLRLDLSSSNR